MKDLDSFTVERLEGWLEVATKDGPWRNMEVCSGMLTDLLNIALAAKRAEPEWYVVITSVGVWQSRYKTRSEAENHIKPWNKDYWIKEIYTTPQFSSPEIPKDWPTEDMVIAGFESGAWDALSSAVLKRQGWPYSCRESAECVTGIFKAMLAAAPEPQNQQQNIPEIIPQGWTSSDPANAALVMLDRIDTMDSADDDRIEDIKLIIRQLAAEPEKGNG